MRRFGRFVRGCVVTMGGYLFVAVAVADVRTDEASALSTIRALQASQTNDEPPSLPGVVAEPATPAADSATAPTSTSDVAQPAQPAEPKLPIAPLPFGRANSSSQLTHMTPAPQLTNQTHPALGYYGGNQARATLNQFPRRPPIQLGARQSTRQPIKPFQTAQRDPTVSPYLNLYREENDSESAPNYYAFVRPQFEQNEANRLQQAEIQQLTRQLNGRSGTVASPQYRTTNLPSTGTRSRYMDTAQFYGSWR